MTNCARYCEFLTIVFVYCNKLR